MNTVRLIKDNGWDSLKELAISISNHPQERVPLRILNYSQLDSPKTHPVVMECRSLILDYGANVASKSFTRFFNVGEATEITDKFDWTNYKAFEKVDGSLTQMFCYNGEWMMATRSTFGQWKMEDTNFTWEDLFWSLLKKHHVESVLNPNHTYVFELCSPYNQVVTLHSEPKLVLLDIVSRDTVFIRGTLDNHISACDYIADYLRVQRPKIYNINSKHPQDIKDFVNSMDGSEEGLVIQDYSGMRLKCKNTSWLARAALKNNNNFYYKDLYDVVWKGETSEVCTYFPLVKEKCQRLEDLIRSVKTMLKCAYSGVKNEIIQKDFAIKLNQLVLPLRWVLFECRRHNKTVDEIFSDSKYYEKIKKGILEQI